MGKLIVRNIKRKLNIWSVLSILGVIMVLLPSLSIFANLLTPASENWLHIKEYLLKDYIKNSLFLITFTGLFTVIIGVILAWLVSAYEFPLKNFF